MALKPIGILSLLLVKLRIALTRTILVLHLPFELKQYERLIESPRQELLVVDKPKKGEDRGIKIASQPNSLPGPASRTSNAAEEEINSEYKERTSREPVEAEPTQLPRDSESKAIRSANVKEQRKWWFASSSPDPSATKVVREYPSNEIKSPKPAWGAASQFSRGKQEQRGRFTRHWTR